MKTAFTILSTLAMAATVSARACGVKNDSGGHAFNLECTRPNDVNLEPLCCNSFGCDTGAGPAVFGGSAGDISTKDNCQCNCIAVPA